MKRFLNFPNGVNDSGSNRIYKNFKINADNMRAGAYFDAGTSNVRIPLTAQMNVVIQLELEATADDAKYKAFANAINEALVSNPGTPIIDLPGWFLSNVEVTNP